MKILYVGDNRIRGNYGCRATSTALSMLIGENHEIVGRITGKYTHIDTGKLFYWKYLPSFVYKTLGKISIWERIRPVLHDFFYPITRKHYLLGPYDFVTQNMEQMITNLKKCLPCNPHLKEFDIESYDFDVMVVNGEGSFIFCSPPWRESLVIAMCMYWANKLGKKVYFLNGMFSDMPGYGVDNKTKELVNQLFSKIKATVVRDPVSLEYVKNNFPLVKAQYVPDALFSWFEIINDSHQVDNGKYYLAHSSECDESYYNQDFTNPYILISGSSSYKIGVNPATTIEVYVNLIQKIKSIYSGNIFLIQVCEGDYFLNKVGKITNIPVIGLETPIIAAAKILASSQVFISGRYHPSIMASQGGTPCIFLGSNSHKTLSLQIILNYSKIKEFNTLPSEEEIKEICNLTISYVNNQDILRPKIKNQCYLLYKESIKLKNIIK